MATPLPPPLLIPDGFELPAPALELPGYREFQWVNPPQPMQRQRAVPKHRQQQPESVRLRRSPLSRGRQRASRPQLKPPARVSKPRRRAASVPTADPPAPPEFKEVRQFTVPIIDKEIPVPATEIVVTAVTTAGVSSVAAVAGTLMANALFQRLLKLLKPVIKALLKKLAKLRKKPAPLSWARARRLERRRGKSH